MKRFVFFLLFTTGAFFGCKSHKNLSKSTTACKNATCDTSMAFQTVNLPVFIPIAELQDQLYRMLFAPNHGRFYPCPGDNCDKMYKELYIENPDIIIDNNILSIKMHLAGNTHVLFLNQGISENIKITSIPEVKNDTLYFRNIKMEQSSDNILLNLTSVFFKDEIERQIQKKACYSFRPVLDSITKQVKKQFPIKWYSATLMLNLKKVHLNKVSILSTPQQGILIDFSAEVITDNSFLEH